MNGSGLHDDKNVVLHLNPNSDDEDDYEIEDQQRCKNYLRNFNFYFTLGQKNTNYQILRPNPQSFLRYGVLLRFLGDTSLSHLASISLLASTANLLGRERLWPGKI